MKLKRGSASGPGSSFLPKWWRGPATLELQGNVEGLLSLEGR